MENKKLTYGYDANGERVYKLTGISNLGQVNSGPIKAQAIFDDAVLYPNPYIVISQTGYTKHYYAGTERIATVIGTGGFDDMVTTIDKLSSQHDWDIVKTFYSYYQNYDPFFYQKIVSQPEKTEDIFGQPSSDLDYQCKPTELVMVDILNPPDILLKSISIYEQNNGSENKVYFYHGDHLGSANWITDYTGAPIQYIHYAPYGELIDNQHASGSWYDERYKFTGKERDWETGYDYFGARYWWLAGTWLSVDPLADKYPNISPYAYAAWNPVNRIDPDGRDWYEADGEIRWTDHKSQQAMDKAKLAGRYLGEAVVVFSGHENECWGTDNTLTGENANPAIATIYGVNGKDDIQTYRGMTTPQSDSYSTLNAGDYKMFYQDMATSVYGEKGALSHNPPIAPALTYRITKPDGTAILDGTKKSVRTTMEAIFMHRTDWGGTANHSSKGCMIIDGRQWRNVESQLKKSSNIFLRVTR